VNVQIEGDELTMRIGIVLSLNPAGGGIYQYSLVMIQALGELREQGVVDDAVVFAEEPQYSQLSAIVRDSMQIVPLSGGLWGRGKAFLRKLLGEGALLQAYCSVRRQIRARLSGVSKQGFPNPDLVRKRPQLGNWFHRFGVEFMLFPAPTTLSFEAGLPYVIAVHDLQHRLQPEFPEVSANGGWERREYLFRNGTRYATLILADSEVGKEDILKFYGPYGVTSDRVKVLPFLPANYLSVDVPESGRVRVRQAYRLPERYLFYPAQFWPHKNHARIVRALSLLKKEGGDEIHVVFCGFYTGEIRERTFQEVMTLAHRLGVAHQVQYLGYVPDEDMSGLYAEAVGLVMPTFFGPTNIPILEAWALDCPVLTSDIRGVREQVGDAGLLVDPRSVEAIAEGIYRLWTDEALRRALVERGRQRLARYTPEDFRRRLAHIIQEANERVREGKCPVYALSNALHST